MKKSWKTYSHPIGWGSHHPSQWSSPQGNAAIAGPIGLMLEGHFQQLMVKTLTATKIVSKPAATAQEVELKQEDAIHWWPSSPPEFAEIAWCLCRDNLPWVVTGIPPELAEDQSPIQMVGSTMFSTQLFQDVTSGYDHQFNEFGRHGNCIPSGWPPHPYPARWRFGLSTQLLIISYCLPLISSCSPSLVVLNFPCLVCSPNVFHMWRCTIDVLGICIVLCLFLDNSDSPSIV